LGLAADFVLIVIAGLVGGIFARALRLPLLVGYVAAGVVVGPHTAGPTVVQIRDIETLAEIGVALLLFSLGLEVSFREMRMVRRLALGGGTLQVVLTTALGAVAAWAFLRTPVTESIWLGAMVTVSSTMVVLKVLAADGVTGTLASRAMIGLLLVQDLAVIPMLIVLPQLNQPEGLALRLAISLGWAALFLTLVYGAGAWLLPGVMRRILLWGSRELFLVAVVAAGVGVGAAMHAAGFSFALGAFVAGLVLSESEFSHQALSDVAPLRDIFGLLFFVTVGMLFDPRYAWENAGLIALVVLVIILGKALIFGGIAAAFGYRKMAPWLIGMGLAQIGEFSFVLARAGLAEKLVSQGSYNLILASTVFTMALSPAVSRLALPLGRAWRRWQGESTPAQWMEAASGEELSGHVIVGGYGRTGQTVVRALRSAGVPRVIVELNYATLQAPSATERAAIWGDVARDEILQAAQASRAKMLVLTLPDRHATRMAMAAARRMNPDVIIVARAAERAAGVAVVHPELEAGLELARQGLLLYGHGEGGVERITAELRQALYG
jgi:monovalent cation:H+ antiporter-2, CPA2 family